jgi:hypothetical protein
LIRPHYRWLQVRKLKPKQEKSFHSNCHLDSPGLPRAKKNQLILPVVPQLYSCVDRFLALFVSTISVRHFKITDAETAFHPIIDLSGNDKIAIDIDYLVLLAMNFNHAVKFDNLAVLVNDHKASLRIVSGMELIRQMDIRAGYLKAK